MAGLCAPLSTLRQYPRGHLRMTRGRCGSLLLHRDGLAPSTPCRSPGALRITPDSGHCSVQPACLKRARFRLDGWLRTNPIAAGPRSDYPYGRMAGSTGRRIHWEDVMTCNVQRDPESIISRRTLVHGMAIAAGASVVGVSGAL